MTERLYIRYRDMGGLGCASNLSVNAVTKDKYKVRGGESYLLFLFDLLLQLLVLAKLISNFCKSITRKRLNKKFMTVFYTGQCHKC